MLENQLEIIPVENNQTYYGVARGTIKRCVKAVGGAKGCAEFTANADGKVTVRLSVEVGFFTPFQKTFVIDSNKTFEFKSEDGRFSFKISITGFELKDNRINFKISLNFCIENFCTGEASFDISLPVPGAIKSNSTSSSNYDDYLLHLLLALQENKTDCNCK